jgi:mannose-6-phosphate isomerase
MATDDMQRGGPAQKIEDGMRRKGQAIGPVVLRPIFQDRIWGVETLPAWYAQPAPGQRVGEVWLTAETCVVEFGEVRGGTLAELVRLNPVAFGAVHSGASLEGFPLLVKLLFPREKLSVQVHPNDEQAQALGLGRGKTECWYVLSAEAGAQVAVGFREQLTPEQIRSAIEQRTLEDKLRYLQVKAGDMVYVDAGTVHAIGPGMVVLETQQYSDVTYRLYDYGRPRELHVGAGLAVSRTSSEAGLVSPTTMDGFDRLVSSSYFVVDRFTVREGIAAELGKAGQLQMVVAVGEACTIESGARNSLSLPPGWAVVLPAENVEYSLRGAGEVIRIAQP